MLILTAARSNEIREAVWGEIDLVDALWVIPAARMKAGKEHRVPLCPRAIAILTARRQEANARTTPDALVFPNEGGSAHSSAVFAALLRRMGVAGITVHGFRSTFRDWAGNETEHAREITETALAHAVGNATERAYRRSDALERRRALMLDWDAYCGSAQGNDRDEAAIDSN